MSETAINPVLVATGAVVVDNQPYWLADPGHSWLVVPGKWLFTLEVPVTQYSYWSRNRDLVYLEEDVDAPAYLAKCKWRQGLFVVRNIISFEQYRRQHGLVGITHRNYRHGEYVDDGE